MERDNKDQPLHPDKNEPLEIRPAMPAENLERDEERVNRSTKDTDEMSEAGSQRQENLKDNKHDGANVGDSKY